MRTCLSLALILTLLSACGGGGGSRTYEDDDDHYTQEDLDAETDDVYRPSNSGEDDDGVTKGSREKPVRDGSTVEATPTKETPKEQPIRETPAKEQPVKETPVKETPVKETPVKETPVKETPVKETPVREQPKPDRSALIKAFTADVSARMDTMEDHKLWKEFVKALEKFNDRVDKGMEKQNNERGKDVEEAWANAIVSWYEVRYLYELWIHLNWKIAKDFEPGIGFDATELAHYKDADFSSANCAQTKAAYELAEGQMKEVRQFQTDILKYDLVASKVYVDPKQEKKWSSEKQKWQDATEGKFDEKDIKKYK